MDHGPKRRQTMLTETNGSRQVETTSTSRTLAFHKLSGTIITHDMILNRKLKFIGSERYGTVV